MAHRLMTMLALCLAIASFFSQPRTALWVEYQGDRVAVRAKAPDGKQFSVIVFDRSLLAHNFTGFDVGEAPPPKNYVPLVWAP